ncbi:MAG: tetratricopeptide repeat protein, partial [Deltaproteobacteria bacterium]|nr:tetratricopeptide repeat protein [Deltaproteobacteria bacterium]
GGESLFNQKDYASAMDAYRHVLWSKRKAQFEDQVYSKLGYSHFLLKHYDEAIGYWERLLKEFPDYSEKNEILYWLAESHLLKEDYRNGVRYVNQLKGDSILYPRGLTNLGWYHFQRKEWKEANHYFLKIAAEFPEHRSSPPIALLIGQCYLNQNNYDQAKNHLKRLVQSTAEEGKDKGYYLLGWIAYREERFDEALEHFQKLRGFSPSSPFHDEAQYWTGWSYFRKKDFDKAIEEFQWLLQLYPESPFVSPSLLKVGDSFYNLKQYGNAIKAYQRLIREHGKSKEAPEADYGILLSLLQEKRYESFVARAEGFLKRYPQHPLAGQALMQLGEYYQQARMTEKALKTYQDLVRLYPQNEWAEETLFRIALLLKSERRLAEAVDEVERFIKNHPKNHLIIEAYLEAGELHLLLKTYPKALERFEWVIKNHPQVPLAKRSYLGMEEAYRGMGKVDEAEKMLKEYIEKYPHDETRFEAYLKMGLLQLTLKRFPDAITSFSTALRSPEERVTSQAQFRLGEAYAHAGNREAAILQFSKVFYLYPHLTELVEEALLKVGALYVEEKRFSEAKQVYQKLLEKTNREERRRAAKKMLDQIQGETTQQ